MRRFDICVVGHITQDIIVREGSPTRCQPGGVAYYAGVAFAALGLNTAVVTRLAIDDTRPLLAELQTAGAHIICSTSDATTTFENIYLNNSFDTRRQRLRAVAAPFRPSDVGDLEASLFHLGPLTHGDMSVEFLHAVTARSEKVALDVQGLVRSVADQSVVLEDWREKASGLACIDILKANQCEAKILTGEEDPELAVQKLAGYGVEEIVVTLSSSGSLLFANGRTHSIPAYPPRQVTDATGCGDTYFAGYLSQRLQSREPVQAARFAAALATLKLERAGAFRGQSSKVAALLAESTASAKPDQPATR